MLASLIKVLIALNLAVLVDANCRRFTLIQGSNNTYTTDGTPVPVSPGVTCSLQPNRTCGLGLGSRSLNVGQVLWQGSAITSTYSTTNVSTDPMIARDIIDVAARGVGTQFFSPLMYNVTGGFSVSPGRSGWLTWTPIMKCLVGTVSDCDGAGYPASGSVITACTPHVYSGSSCARNGAVTFRCAAGTISFQNATEAEASNLTCTACQRAELTMADATVVLGVNAAGRLSGPSLAMIVALLALALVM